MYRTIFIFTTVKKVWFPLFPNVLKLHLGITPLLQQSVILEYLIVVKLQLILLVCRGGEAIGRDHGFYQMLMGKKKI